MWTVYILKSISANKHYVGCSNDLERRLGEHNRGESDGTKWHKPWTVIYTESFAHQSDAYAREKEIKQYKGGNAFRKLLEK